MGSPRLVSRSDKCFLAVAEVLAGVLSPATAFAVVKGRQLCESQAVSMEGGNALGGGKLMRAFLLVHLPSGLTENGFFHIPVSHLAALVWEKTHAEAYTIPWI